MRVTPILIAAFVAGGSTLAFAQTGGGTGAGAGAGTGAGGGTAGVDAGAGTGAGGTSTGATASGAQGSTGIGGDTRPRRSPLTGVYRRGDDMAPLIIPQEEYVRMRRPLSRQW